MRTLDKKASMGLLYDVSMPVFWLCAEREMKNDKWFHLLPKNYQNLCPGHPMSHNKIACSVTFFSRQRLSKKPKSRKPRRKVADPKEEGK